jgi:hypothetical protein
MMCRQFADSQQGRVLLATLRDDAGAEGVLQSLPPAQQGLFRDWRDRRPTPALALGLQRVEALPLPVV